jgi:hypothetical protein
VRAQEGAPARPVAFHGLVQIWFTAREDQSTFRVRRTELKLSGSATGHVEWTVQVDPSKVITLRNRAPDELPPDVEIDNGSVLQDALVSYRLSPSVAIDAGQFKLPLSREGIQSSASLETIERAQFASAVGKFADVRDLGVRARGLVGPLGWHAGVFNGLGESFNRSDDNAQKAVVARTVIAVLSGFEAGVSGAHTLGRAAEGERYRWGGDLAYADTRFGLRAEVLGGADGDRERVGFYALTSYRWQPRWQAVLRYDAWDNQGVTQRDYVAGLNYLVEGNHAKLQLNFIHTTFADAAPRARHILLINGQAAW